MLFQTSNPTPLPFFPSSRLRIKLSRIRSHLCIGTGKPWAGHSSGRVSPCLETNPRELSIVGNLGLTLPTGSVEDPGEEESVSRGSDGSKLFSRAKEDREPPVGTRQRKEGVPRSARSAN
ncbi:hypothetical protein KM043_002938 [Ampulex compressa]|nr:hypothetical protein KM043_002938 [Ampulex compressa]